MVWIAAEIISNRDKNNRVVGYVATVTDITERKMAAERIEKIVMERTKELISTNKELQEEIAAREQVEQALRDSERRYYTLTSISPVGIFHADPEGKLTYANQRMCEILGLTLEQALGDGWIAALHPEDRERVVNEVAYATQHELPIKSEFRLLTPQDKVYWVIGQAIVQKDNNKIVGRVGTLTDITKRREAEEKLWQNQLELSHYSRMSTAGEMVSGIAHEVNQPLAMITNYATGCLERLKCQESNSEIMTMMQRVYEQAERAGSIIHHFKQFLSKKEFKKELYNINDIIRNSTELLTGIIKEKKIKLKYQLDVFLPPILVDRIQIEQVIVNLMSNSIEAMEMAESEPRDIIIETSHDSGSNFVIIGVADTGPGITPEAREKIFSPFYTTKKNGMGMGLSIIKTIVEMHGGDVFLENKVKGSQFYVKLPVCNKEME